MESADKKEKGGEEKGMGREKTNQGKLKLKPIFKPSFSQLTEATRRNTYPLLYLPLTL